jgi:hypothetical protein
MIAIKQCKTFRRQIYKQYYLPNRAWFWTFLCVGLSGVVPIMISLKQSGFYMLTALPFLAIAWALLVSSWVENRIAAISAKLHKILLCVSATVLLAGIVNVIVHIGTVSREKDLLHDVHCILQKVPQHSIVSISPNIRYYWQQHGYFARYGYVSLDSDTTSGKQFLIVSDTADVGQFNEHYSRIPLETKFLTLYKKCD